MQSETEKLDDSTIYHLGIGLIYKVVCAPKSMTQEQIENRVSADDPPGTSRNQWTIAEPDDTREDIFKGTNQLQCPDCSNRTHWLMNC